MQAKRLATRQTLLSPPVLATGPIAGDKPETLVFASVIQQVVSRTT